MVRLATPGGVSSPLRVNTVGTGTCVPRLERRGACVLVRGGGAAIAVDLGLGSLHGLLRSGVVHRDLDAVCLTHLHPDHTAELVPFLFAANYDEVPRTRRLCLAGGTGLRGYLEGLAAAQGNWLAPRAYELEVRELSPGGKVDVKGLTGRVGAVRHIPSSLAFRFECAGRSVVVSGDTGPSPELEAFARGADLLVLEASLAPDRAAAGHLTAAQAGAIARQAAVGHLAVVHLYPAAEAAQPGRFAEEAFGGPVTVAEDGMEFEV